MTTAELITKHGAMAAYHANAEQLAEITEMVAENSPPKLQPIEVWYAEIRGENPPANKMSFEGQSTTRPYRVFQSQSIAACERYIAQYDSFRAIWEIR